LLGAFGAEYVGSIGDESLSDQRVVAHGTDEAVVVPVAILERNEASSSNASNWFAASGASLGKEFSEAFGTVWLVVSRSETLTSQWSIAIRTREALSVPRFVLVSYASASNNLIALNASGSELFFIACCAVNVVFPRDEGLGANGALANAAGEALLVPLSAFVFHLFGSCAEDFSTSVAACGESGVVAVCTIDLLVLGAKGLVDQRYSALVAKEASLVPVLLLVWQILGVDSDSFAAFFALVGKDLLVATDTIGMVVP
jgi:hypothetical protein